MWVGFGALLSKGVAVRFLLLFIGLSLLILNLGCASSQIEAVNKNPEKFENTTVEVKGQLDEKKGEHAFVLDGPGIWNDELVVITRKSLKDISSDLKEGKGVEVKVKGEVKRVSLAEISEEYDIDFSSETKKDLSKKNLFLLADDIQITVLR